MRTPRDTARPTIPGGSMKITLRMTISLLAAAAIAAPAFTWLQVRHERERIMEELDERSAAIAQSLEEPIMDGIRVSSIENLARIADHAGGQTLLGIAVYDSVGNCLAMSRPLSSIVPDRPDEVLEALQLHSHDGGVMGWLERDAYLTAVPLVDRSHRAGVLLIGQDASFIDARIDDVWRVILLHLLVQMVLIIIATLLVVRWSITGPIAQIAGWVRRLRVERSAPVAALPRGDLLQPLAAEVTLMARSLAQARESARQEARLRIESESVWTAERLKEHVKNELNGRNLFVVSNREPYMHVGSGNTIRCIVPAGGLVTALDPVLRACGGLWLANGSGDADRETVGPDQRLRVPPDEPAYTLRRVFLTKEEDDGYYYGFSNEGIWPLCHITHTRPVFILQDWIQYQAVNQKFADALLEEIRNEESPLVLIQDYHFALLPLLIKSKRPDARVAIFWHIPWPNPEVFGICPWKQELLLGLLGADLIGFHIQFHCNNFLETADRFLECNIKWDQFSVERQGQSTAVRPFPISVAHPFETERLGNHVPARSVKEALLKKNGTAAAIMAVGVDRIDYTKGILERFRAVQRFLEKYPEYLGTFTFVELGAPSRTEIQRYHDLVSELDRTVEEINTALQTSRWKPIIFLKAHHDHQTIGEYYRAADVCMVTSLHDGMNLVAKEFIATRSDEDGVLILSQFTGAARELPDALIVNPYDIEEMADTLRRALTMDENERHRRMRDLRSVVKDRNVYRWAANIITTLSHLRVSGPVITAEGS